MSYFESSRRNFWRDTPASAENIRLDVALASHSGNNKYEVSYRTLICEYSGRHISPVPFEEEATCFERYRHCYEEDSIIDNSEALLDSLPRGKQPVGGGFYINYGPLQLEPKPKFAVEKTVANSVKPNSLSNSSVKKLIKKVPKLKPTSNLTNKMPLKKILTERSMQVSELVKPTNSSLSALRTNSLEKAKPRFVKPKSPPNSVTVVELIPHSFALEPKTNSSLEKYRLGCFERNSMSNPKGLTRNSLKPGLKSNRKSKNVENNSVLKPLVTESTMNSQLFEPEQDFLVKNKLAKMIPTKRMINTLPSNPMANVLPCNPGTNFLRTKPMTYFLPTKSESNSLPTKPMKHFLPIKTGTNCLTVNSMTDFLPTKLDTNSFPTKPIRDLLPTEPRTNCLSKTSMTYLLPTGPMKKSKIIESTTSSVEKMSETNYVPAKSAHLGSKLMSKSSTKMMAKSHVEQNKLTYNISKTLTNKYAKNHRDSDLKKQLSGFDVRSSQNVSKRKDTCKRPSRISKQVKKEIEALKHLTGKYVSESEKTDSAI